MRHRNKILKFLLKIEEKKKDSKQYGTGYTLINLGIQKIVVKLF